MAGKTYFRWKHITSSTVAYGTGAAGSQGTDNTQKQVILHTITINSGAAAATFQVYDYNSTSSPPAGQAVGGVITIPAGGLTSPTFMQYDVMMDIGITIITSGTIDITICAA